MKRFLVSGGCGFIGSHLVEELDRRGAIVTVVDDLSSGVRENLSACGGRVVFCESKLEDFDFSPYKDLTAVFHLAAQASVPQSIRNPYRSSSSNLNSTMKVIEFCAMNKIPLIYASSAAVYGNMKWGIESGNVDLLSPYAVDKFAAEMYCKMANRLYLLKSCGLRLFNVYGPRQSPRGGYSGVISIFVRQLLRGEKLAINGGFQTRDFVYVEDVVKGMIRAYEYLVANGSAEISNLLTGTSVSINDLVSILGGVLNVEPKAEFRELPPGDPVSSSGSTEKMTAMLGLQPQDFTRLELGLVHTVNWMRNSDPCGWVDDQQ